jgi:hypothetical protein
MEYDQCSGDFSMSLNTIECSVVISPKVSFILMIMHFRSMVYTHNSCSDFKEMFNLKTVLNNFTQQTS